MKLAKIITAILIILFALSSFYMSKNIGTKSTISQKKETPGPARAESFKVPSAITSSSAIVVDNKSGAILYEKEKEVRHLPASTTKLLTALVALENCTKEQIVNVGFVEDEPNSMGLATGDQLTIENLISGLLINSANDAAYTLSYACAQSTQEFVFLMNQKAKNLEMKNSHFNNPAGFDDPGQYSTAEDLAKLARAAVANPLISKVVATKSTVVTDITGIKTYYLENVNKLLGQINGLEGIKTGQTEGAQELLISKATRNNNTIIVVIMKSEDRFTETKDLIEWAFSNYKWL